MSNLARIARNDDLHKVRLFEQYSHLIHQWGRTDISIPSFESWQHAQHIMFPGPRALHASLDDKEIFSLIETLIIYLGRAKLALHFDHPQLDVEQESAKILAAVFSLDEQYVAKLQALLGFYVQRPERPQFKLVVEMTLQAITYLSDIDALGAVQIEHFKQRYKLLGFANVMDIVANQFSVTSDGHQRNNG